MACNNIVLAGLAKDCSSNLGGVKKLHIANYEDVTIPTGVTGDTINIDMTPFKEYHVRRGASSMTSTATKNVETGNNFVTTIVTFNIARMEAGKRAEMVALLSGEVAVIVEDANGNKYFLGENNPVEATNGGGTTGTAMTDANQYNIELTDISLEMPRFVVSD